MEISIKIKEGSNFGVSYGARFFRSFGAKKLIEENWDIAHTYTHSQTPKHKQWGCNAQQMLALKTFQLQVFVAISTAISKLHSGKKAGNIFVWDQVHESFRFILSADRSSVMKIHKIIVLHWIWGRCVMALWATKCYQIFGHCFYGISGAICLCQ